jgi:hypothetical protein
MSTLAYAALTTKREQAPPRTSETTSSPGVKSYTDAAAALVPAEVLTLHGFFLTATTETKDSVTKITAEGATTLYWAFFGLIALSIMLYVVPRLVKWDWWQDSVRALIPPAAFIAWTMLQKSTAFDAICPQLQSAPRLVIALFIAAVLAVVAKVFADKADQKKTTP